MRLVSTCRAAFCFMLVLVVCTGCSSLEKTTRREDRVRSSKTDTSLVPALLEAYVKAHPEAFGPSLAMAKRLAAEGKHADADALLRRFDAEENDVRILTWRASLATDPKERERLARAAIPYLPDADLNWYRARAKAYFQLGCALADQGRWAEASENLNFAAIFGQTQSGAWWMLAVAQSQAGKHAEAVHSCLMAGNRAWTFERRDPEWVFRFLADLYEANGAEPEAVARWRARADACPDAASPRAYPAIPTPEEPISLPTPFDEWVNLGLLFDNSSETPLKVAKVLPNSTAQDAGLQRGDVLLSINGHTFTDANSVFVLSSTRTDESWWTLRFTRAGAELESQGRVVKWAEGSQAFERLIDEGLVHEREDRIAEAAGRFAVAWDSISDYNAELLNRWAICLTLAGGFEHVNRLLQGRLRISPHDDYLLFTLAHVHALAARNAPQGTSAFALRAKAAQYARHALVEAPDDGLYEAFLGLVYIPDIKFEGDALPDGEALQAILVLAAPDEIDYWGTLKSNPRITSLERSMALGHGGWAQLELARWLDSTESSLRATEKSRRQAMWQSAFVSMAAGMAMGVGSGSGGRGFGSNPWRDYGYEAQAIYGVDSARNQMIFGY